MSPNLNFESSIDTEWENPFAEILGTPTITIRGKIPTNDFSAVRVNPRVVRVNPRVVRVNPSISLTTKCCNNFVQ